MSVAPRRKGVFARPLAEYVLKQVDPLVAKKGFGEASLLMQWREIVGARIADICAPERLQWPARGRKPSPDKAQEPATLILRVEPGFGLEIQHMAPAIVDRVNAHLGWRCVSKVTLRQQALAQRAEKNRPRIAPVDPAARARAVEASEGVAEESLRAALVKLGERALAPRRIG
ncbi:DciA family protein [Methylocystis sp. MJC1]|jgi:hypothetical protein|uniref:DUF721 domain-containing protein n=1 Tax=Methylocystis sp. MJC1 TaxID=2654282 RepID=UPI0013E9B7FB|nr:DciA family protein [Methylocystis sp. MJC1]KAF2990655.1 hypothetical protein MJC1_02079 [Methylocystis sp. MJC1]MBU6528744.1 DUF721 domain-containing protein [Methylocystis sp. MJC1]UZX11631.1 DciA family protein [Methylocystis sp. MJC1]